MNRPLHWISLLSLAAAFGCFSCQEAEKPAPDDPVATSLRYEEVAGSVFGNGLVDGKGASANFESPGGLAQTATGTILIADTWNNAIRSMTPDYVVSTLVGKGSGIQQQGHDDGVLTNAKFWNPALVTVDPAGTIYVLDGRGNYIRKISGNQVSTVTERTSAPRYLFSILGLPSGFVGRGMGYDPVKNRLLLTLDDSRIWAVNPQTGQLTVAAGLSGGGYQDGPALTARFSELNALVVDASGTVYVAENYRKAGSVGAFNARIRKINPAGEVSTLAVFEATDSQYLNALALDKDRKSLVAFIVRQPIVGKAADSNKAYYRLVAISPAGITSEILEGTDPYIATATDKFVFGRAGGMVVNANGDIYLSNRIISKISGR